ncbi:MAG: hypothetical protein H0X37_02855 [Herpetosiphonaceae bacterium]|nr:hypothetical protein [Herpetosiphonaceae bacterium]
MSNTTTDNDLATIDGMAAVQTILRVLQRITGMRIALVARVTEDAWTAYAVLDEANFGLKPGDQLELQTTY